MSIESSFRMVTFARKLFSKHSFSYCLGTNDAILLTDSTKKCIRFSIKVPESVCKSNKNGKSVLPASSAMALFDELTTYGMMFADKNFRPGVSVHLNTELLLHDNKNNNKKNRSKSNNDLLINAGDDIIVETHITKIGRTVGFCDMKILNSKGKTIAITGKHIKYLPMGIVWDIITSPYLLPLTLPLFESQWAKQFFQTPIGKSIGNSLFGVGDMEKHKSNENHTDQIASSFDILGLECISQPTDDLITFAFSVTPKMTNVLGDLHGGAVGMCAEEACSKLLQLLPNYKDRIFVSKSIEVRYLSSMKGKGLTISPRIIQDNTSINGEIVVEGEIKNSKNFTCAQFEITLLSLD